MFKWVGGFLKVIVLSCVLFVANYVCAGITLSDPVEFDESFVVSISSDVWEQFGGQPIYDLQFTEFYRPFNQNSWVSSGASLLAGATNHTAVNKPGGEYKYELYIRGGDPEEDGNEDITQTLDSNILAISDEPAGSPSEYLDLHDFDIYYGDFNGDGVGGDIYFHQKNQFVLIAGEISVPLFIEQEHGFVLYRYNSSIHYSQPQTFRLSKEELSIYQQLSLNTDFFEGDINGDGNPDYFLRGADTDEPSVVVLQTALGYPQAVDLIVSEASFNPSDRSNIVKLEDYNQDGRADLLLMSDVDGYVVEAIYSKSGGILDEAFYTVSGLNQIFNFVTYPANTVGTTPGKFSVTESGAAMYAVPILTPEGTAGVTPSVGLTYSSQGGNGIVGKGWALNGFSAITRCQQTLNQDNNALPISWDSSDRFCLDGKRLVLVEGASYGVAGSKYRTEIDSQVLVTLHGSVSEEPDYFSVIKKDGSVTYYGLTSGLGVGTLSKQTFTAGKTIAWYQAVTLDNAGNPIKNFYLHSNGHDFRLDRIEYAYGATGVAATTPNTVIKFSYEARPDKVKGYLGGVVSSQQLRLKRIDVNNTVNTTKNIRTYHLSYNLEAVGVATSRRSLLGAIQECIGSSCKAPTKLNWDLVSGEIDAEADGDALRLINGNPLQIRDFKQADFNGDGVQDMAWIYLFESTQLVGQQIDTRLRYAISVNGSLEFANFGENQDRIKAASDSKDVFRIEPIDYNADGRSDLAVYCENCQNEENWKIYLSVPTDIGGEVDWRLSDNPVLTGISAPRAKFADINGDGLVDMIDGERVFLLGPRFENPSEEELKSNTFYEFKYKYKSWDFGLRDQAYCLSEQEKDDLENGLLSLSESSWSEVNQFLDFNGDGLMDIVGTYHSEGVIDDDYDNRMSEFSCKRTFLFRQTGDGFKKVSEFTKSSDSTLSYLFASEAPTMLGMDANSDGLSDLLLQRNGEVAILISDGLTLGGGGNRVLEVDSDSTLQVMDHNRDGHPDIVEFRHAEDNFEYQPRIRLWNVDTQAYDQKKYLWLKLKGKSTGYFMDVNGDGNQDFVRFEGKDIDTYLFEPDDKAFEAISSIDQGNGSIRQIIYEPINTSENYSGLEINPGAIGTTTGSCTPQQATVCAVYTVYEADDFYYALNKGIDFGYSRLKAIAPVLEMNGPFFVVTGNSQNIDGSTLDNNALSPGGNSGTSSVVTTEVETEYFYGEAKIQAGGAGFLGFRQFSVLDKQSGLSTTTVLRQDFPFVGDPLSTYVNAPDNTGVLSESHNVYDLFAWPNDVNDVVKEYGTTALGPIKPYIRESVKVNYLTRSSVESGGEVEILSGPEVNIGGCTFGVSNCHPHLNKTTTQVISHKVVALNEVDNHLNTATAIVENSGQGLNQTIVTHHSYGSASDTINLHGYTLSYPELARLTRTEVHKFQNGEEEPVQFSNFTYYGNGEANGQPGMLKTEEVSPESAGNIYQKENFLTLHKYNELGLKVEKGATGWDGYQTVSRRASTTYDSSGRFVDFNTDGLGHKLDEVISRNEYGTPTFIQGVNGASSTKNYDAWGREIYSSINPGGSTSTHYVFCSNTELHCPSSARTAVYERSSAAGNTITSVVFTDEHSREVRSGSISFDGRMVYVDTEYDNLGRVVRKSLPFFEEDRNNSQNWVRNYYDELGRTILTYVPDGSIGKTQYEGYQTISFNDLLQRKVETKNGLGQLVEVEDHLGGKIFYSYNTSGDLISTTAYEEHPQTFAYGTIVGLCEQPTSNFQVVLCYDRLGRKTKMWDPDKGYWTYEYNAFGELIKQVNGNGHYVETRFDELGRSKERWDYKNNGVLEGYTSWHYDDEDDQGQPVENAILQTTAVSYSADRQHTYGDAADLGQHITRYIFDEYGRPDYVETKLPDGNVYRSEQEYDNEGRIEIEYDALHKELSWIDEENNPLDLDSGIRNHYNQFGFLDYVVNLEDDQKIYEATEFDENGNLRTAKLSDGKVLLDHTYDQYTGLLTSRTATAGSLNHQLAYSWDTLGNLGSRVNHNSALSGINYHVEEFCYDGLNRLVKSFENENTNGALSYATCPGESGFDVTYDDFGNIEYKAGVGDYDYGEMDSAGHRAGPHALTSLNNASVKFRYDNNGNLLDDGGREFTYNTFDKPTSISKGLHTTHFAYGPSRSRYKREDTNQNGTETTWYLGNIEKIEKRDGSGIEWRRVLEGGVMHTITSDINNVVATQYPIVRYMLSDHLGSSSLILEESGDNIVVAQAMSFDVWGQRRNATTMADFSESELVNFDHSITTRGYTGHEMLDEVGVIHMNGRIYDAKWGRFLQADPHIQAPTDTQSYNRYAYLRNNPLNATDPSGYFVEYIAKAIIGFTLAKIGGAFDLPMLQTAGAFLVCGVGPQSSGCLASMAFGAAYAGTDSLSKAAFAAAVSYASGPVSEKLGAGFKLLTGIQPNELISRMVVGGTFSEMTGGKFKNGAAMAAFWWLVEGVGAGGPADSVTRTINGQDALLSDQQIQEIREEIGSINEFANTKVGNNGDEVADWLDIQSEALRKKYDIEFGARVIPVKDGAGFTEFRTDLKRGKVGINTQKGDLGRWHNHPAGSSYFSARDVSNAIEFSVDSYVALGEGEILKFDIKSYSKGLYSRPEFEGLNLLQKIGHEDFNLISTRYRTEQIELVRKQMSPHVNPLKNR